MPLGADHWLILEQSSFKNLSTRWVTLGSVFPIPHLFLDPLRPLPHPAIMPSCNHWYWLHPYPPLPPPQKKNVKVFYLNDSKDVRFGWNQVYFNEEDQLVNSPKAPSLFHENFTKHAATCQQDKCRVEISRTCPGPWWSQATKLGKQ